VKRIGVLASVLLLAAIHTSRGADSSSRPEGSWSSVTIVDRIAWEATPRLPTYLEAMDREGGARPWFDDLIAPAGARLADIREHFDGRVLVTNRSDIIVAWEAGESPASGEKLEVSFEGSPRECLGHLMARFEIAEPTWLPDEIRDWHIGDFQRLAAIERKTGRTSGRVNLRDALIQLALHADIRILAIVDASRRPPVLDVWFEGVAVFGLRDRGRRLPPRRHVDPGDARATESGTPGTPAAVPAASDNAGEADGQVKAEECRVHPKVL
jgi:hypothetical protein